MKIVIAGVGKVGFTVAQRLCREGHDVTLIDEKPDVLEAASNAMDAMICCGSCAAPGILREAEAGKAGRRIYKAAGRSLDIPPLIKIALEEYLKGQARVNMELDATKKFSQLMRRLVRNMVMGLWVMALLISSSIICTTDMKPQVLGIPALGFFGYMLAFLICLYVFIRHWFTRNS